ncbi:MAG: hypothetical protein ACPGMR_14935, partial [Pontibacterium sp.]
DLLAGGEGDDALYGEAGDDDIYAGNGNDAGYGGDGADTYYAQSGVDFFDGGDGSWVDSISFEYDSGNSFVVYANGERQDIDLSTNALQLDPNSSGVICFADGSEVSFINIELIEWT